MSPPIPAATNWGEPSEEVAVTVPDVVADDAVAEHGVVEHCRIELHISKWPDVTGNIPRLVAVRRYPMPGWLIDRLENEATPRSH
ncbi:MAG: hypothetical protein ACTHPS_25400 [Streptosporangiaceae bacterium]